MHCTSVEAENRIEAIKILKKEYNKNMVIGFNFWNYYVTGLMRIQL